MENRLDSIANILNKIEGVSIKDVLTEINGIIRGAINVMEQNVRLDFEIEIYPSYPFQINDAESIQFYNKTLKQYNHVNYNGSICIHNYKSPDLDTKLNYDIISLKQWINNYFIEKKQDEHYEHIIVTEREIENEKFAFLFTNVAHPFLRNEKGKFLYSHLNTSFLQEGVRQNTFLVQSFKVNDTDFTCEWSDVYRNVSLHTGLFIYLEKPPVKLKRFTVENWMELEDFVDEDFFELLREFENELRNKENTFIFTPILFGYKITETEIHWQVAIILNNNFPYNRRNILFTDLFEGQFKDQIINWGQTRNTSYEYFFGRGKMNSKLTDAKIAIVGIGAIGSIVAETLVRGGCKKLLIVDYDVKEPENVCRSQYSFSFGISKKVTELAAHLQSISPFLELILNEHVVEIAKTAILKDDLFFMFRDYFNEYDIIFDCTTDNDVAYLLERVELNSLIINLSITNHAQELVCVTKPNLYEWLLQIFRILDRHDNDLYNPTGCWSPTFKASYNDINTLVQFALKQINLCFEKNIPLNNFYLSSVFDNTYNVQIKKF